MTIEHMLLGVFVYLAAAVIAAPIAMRLGLGSVLGYLIAGVAIGPSALNLLGGDARDVMHVAEFGVIVMLFLVGLELQPAKLWALRRAIFGLGLLQVAGTAAALAAIAVALGIDGKTALAAGLILAMSSTAIVLQSLNERGLMTSAAGQASFAVLLFQDLAIIPILALLPLLAVAPAAADTQSASLIAGLPAWQQAVAVLAAVALIVLAGRYLMRPLFRFVADSGMRETFVGLALLIVVAITLLMQFVGLSAALGTFLGGVVLAESEYRHELEQDLEPFKGLLLAVFFIAVGSGIDFTLFAQRPVTLLVLVAGFVAVKLLVLYGLARLFRMTGADAARFAFALAQGGEFAFVLIAVAAGLGLLGATQAGLLVAAVAISMALAPLLLLADERLVQPLYAGGEERAPDVIDQSGAKVIIAGHGRFGMTVGRVLLASGCRPVVLDHDAEQIDVLRRFGFKVYYGDASRLDLLEAAGAREAALLLITIDDADKVLEIVAAAQKHFPQLRIMARAIDRIHAYRLLNAGVSDVFREVFGSSVDMAQQALAAIGRHPYEAYRAARFFKAHDDAMVRKSAPHIDDRARLIDISRAGRAEIENVLSGDRSGGRSGDRAWLDPDQPPADETTPPV